MFERKPEDLKRNQYEWERGMSSAIRDRLFRRRGVDRTEKKLLTKGNQQADAIRNLLEIRNTVPESRRISELVEKRISSLREKLVSSIQVILTAADEEFFTSPDNISNLKDIITAARDAITPKATTRSSSATATTV